MSFKSKIVVAICALLVVTTAGTPAGAFALGGQTSSQAVSQSTAPSTPGNFRLEKRTGSQLRFNWDWVSGGIGSIHYELAYAGKRVVLSQYYPGYTQNVSDIDLTPGHSYVFSLWAVDETGQHSIVPAQLTFETTSPTAPTNLQLVSMSGNYPDIVSYGLSSDNAGQIRYYEAFLNGKSYGIIPSRDGQFSLTNQIFVQACRNAPRGAATVQLRAYDTSFNMSQLSRPLTVVFP